MLRIDSHAANTFLRMHFLLLSCQEGVALVVREHLGVNCAISDQTWLGVTVLDGCVQVLCHCALRLAHVTAFDSIESAGALLG